MRSIMMELIYDYFRFLWTQMYILKWIPESCNQREIQWALKSTRRWSLRPVYVPWSFQHCFPGVSAWAFHTVGQSELFWIWTKQIWHWSSGISRGDSVLQCPDAGACHHLYFSSYQKNYWSYWCIPAVQVVRPF